ncbi:hypothetical protein [Rhodococcus sp. ARC_M5]|uniref:hypothetical protein n=1 Tax=Rhodococcus sp. ARC_M5 TaxID=2928851 RepID=UPI001FB2CF0A|nr:hypothetical protein [Rhodococcus sp. ARC_M5]MCJ0894179.1 hypothetical protein [Rhodococcus sp. ARC_M5]
MPDKICTEMHSRVGLLPAAIHLRTAAAAAIAISKTAHPNYMITSFMDILRTDFIAGEPT